MGQGWWWRWRSSKRVVVAYSDTFYVVRAMRQGWFGTLMRSTGTPWKVPCHMRCCHPHRSKLTDLPFDDARPSLPLSLSAPSPQVIWMTEPATD